MKDRVYEALQAMRPPFAPHETDIHAMVARRLAEAGIPFRHEARIGRGCRIDYLAEGVGIEIKKGKPKPEALLAQLSRYAACEGVAALVIVTQRSLTLPQRIGDTPLRLVVLSRLWGVALP